MQKIMPMIQQQLSGPIVKDGKVNGISADVSAMNAEINSVRKELNTLLPNLTFADFDQLTDMDFSPNGDPIMPNYNKETASDSLNRFVEILNKGSKYIEMGAVRPPGTPLPSQFSASHAFQMKGPETITGARNGFLNVSPHLGSVATAFGNVNSGSNTVLTFTRPTLNWGNNSGALLETAKYTADLATMNLSNGFQMKSLGVQPLYNASLSNLSGSSLFEYMDQASFKTFSDFARNPLYLDLGSLSTSNDLNGLIGQCPVCMERLRYGDLVGALEPLYKNLPEGVTIK